MQSGMTRRRTACCGFPKLHNRSRHETSLFACEQEAVAEAVDVASDKTMDYGSIALSKADEATSVAARATANKVAEVGSWSLRSARQ